jgi:hypothetical protein
VAPLYGRADPHEVLARISTQRSPPELPEAENLPVETRYAPVGFYDIEAELHGNPNATGRSTRREASKGKAA